ncbi:MAG: PEP-CTERM sorting domain-containing protein [Planctomycetes bacterium]|nr:PEP-CTERM sorting domain-containing protein [Planctomycetota bacterium]
MFSASKSVGVRIFAAVALVAVLTVTASAAPIAIQAIQAPNPASTFQLSFSGNPLPSSFISNTSFALTVDNEPVGTGAASFQSYYQDVAPLTIPDGQGGFVDTGDLTVEIVPGSSGISSFDAGTGIFTTTETYKISYTGDLTSIGLENGGFILFPSTSTGIIAFDPVDPSIGTVVQNWQGTYLPLGLDYTCSVHATFPEPAAISLLGLGMLAVLRRRSR